MKRAITGIVAAGIALGTMAPAAFAATSGPSQNYRSISLGSYSVKAPGIQANDPWTKKATEFMPLWYLDQGLKANGYTAEWNGNQQTLKFTTPDGITDGLTAVTPNPNDLTIYINGVPVVNAPKSMTAIDPYSKHSTAFLPVHYIEQALSMVGFTDDYNGAAGTWKVTLPAAAKYAIAGTPTSSIAVGTKESLSLTNNGSAFKGNVAWSVDGTGAIIDSNGNFVASAPGTYTVTAMVGSVKAATAKIVVFGQAAGIKLSTPANLVANDMSQEAVTVTVVDANGNPVGNFNGTVDLSISGGAALLVGTSTTAYSNGAASLNAVTVTNGQATVNVVAGGVPSLTSTITATNLMATGATSGMQGVNATATVSTVAQKATSIKVTAPSTIGTNLGTEQAAVSAQVEDQTGNPMLSGVYSLTFNISGTSSTFYVGSAATTTAQTLVAVGSTSPNSATASVNLQSVKGNLGVTTVTVTGAGLNTGVANIAGVSVGNSAKLGLAVDPSASASFADQTGSSTTLDPSLLDAAGNTLSSASMPGTVMVLVTDSSGNPTTNLYVGGQPVNATTGEIAVPSGSSFTVTAAPNVAAAGTYNVQLVDTNSTSPLVSSPTVQLTVTAGAAHHISLSAAKSYVAASNTADQFTAQVVDANGNAVAQSGVSVQFYATRTVGAVGSAMLNGVTQDGTTTTAVVYGTTNSSGQATVTLTPQTYSDTWTVVATPSGLTNNAAQSASVTVTPMLTQKVGVTLTNNQSGSAYNGTTSFSAGDSMSLQFSQLDQYGNALPAGENDTLAVTFSNASSIIGLPSASTTNYTVTTSGNSETITGTVSDLNAAMSGLKAGTAGAFNVTAVDQSVTTAQSGSAGGYVFANSTASKIMAVVPSTGYTVSAAGEVGPFTVELVDAGGNPAPMTAPYTLTYNMVKSLLSGTNTTVTYGVYGFRTSANGADSSSVVIPAGTTSVQVWVNASNAGTIYGSGPQTP